MLPRSARITNADDFRRTTKAGVRAGRSTLVLHAIPAVDPDGPVRVGFVVSKQLGNAVTRNRVKRRLRHLVLAQIANTPAGIDVVVRALPAAAHAGDELARDLGSAWSRVLGKVGAA